MDIGVVTVFGGAGFIGRYVVRALAATGARVRIAARRPDRALRLKPMGDVGQVTPVAANIRDDASVSAAVEGSDVVINLVGILYQRGRQSFDAVHREGASRIAAAARQAGAGRLIHFSALGADAASPSAYGRSKAAGEAAVREAFPDATIMRPGIMFGPEDDFFNKFAGLARFAPVLPLIGGGRTRFQPVYVCDVADAVMAALDDPATSGATFELCGPTVYSFRDLLALILHETGRRRLLVPVPFWAATVEAWFLELMPVPLLTRDQVRMLRVDNIMSAGARGVADLGIEPTALEVVLPTYIARYRRRGGRG